MFKRSAPINPQALRNDYSGIERAAAIKQKTLADLGGVISDGFKSFQKKKEDKLKKESAMKIIRDHAAQSGREMTEEEVMGIYKDADADTILEQGAILRDLARYDKEESQRIEQQKVMALAAQRANELAAARNKIAQTQADTSLLGMQTTAAQNAAKIKEDRKQGKPARLEQRRARKHQVATSASIQAMNKTDAEGNPVTPSINDFLTAYRDNGGNQEGLAVKDFYATYPGAKKYTAKYTDDQGNEKTVLFINNQRIDKDDRSAALRSFDSLLEGKDSKGEPLFSDEQKDVKRREFVDALTSKGGSGADPLDAMFARVIEPILQRRLSEGIDSRSFQKNN